jgi:DNA modification methylase
MGSKYELHLGDCLNFMRGMDAGSVDAVVTDPPYGIGESNEKALSRKKLARPHDYGYFDWDNSPASQEQICEILRVSKNQIIFGGNYFVLPPSPCWIVWDKHNGKNDFADCELAWTSYKTAVRKIDWMWNGMIRQGNEERFHPTQKPLGVMRWCIEKYTDAGQTIFDPFMGSGTTGVACMQLGRKFIGCETDPAYFAIAEKRIKAAASQEIMF